LARQQDLAQTWSAIQTRLRTSFSDSTYQIWLEQLEPVALEEGALYVSAPGDTLAWVRRRFGESLRSVASSVEPSIRRVELIEPDAVGIGGADKSGEAAGRTDPAASSRTGLKPTYSFDRFVIGESNRFAHAAALTVAETPGHAYNPLFVYGPPGVGKTHLLQAIGNYVTTHNPALCVHYTTIETFTSAFMKALQHNEVDLFKQSYRGRDVLLLDDVQFLEGKHKTAEELFHTLDALTGAGAQCVITGDRHPARLSPDNPLVQRLQAGLVVDLGSPELETRVAILQKLAACSHVNLEPEVLVHIAGRITSNIRMLEGALIRVVAFASLTGSNVDIDTAEQVLANLYHGQENRPLQLRPASITTSQIQERTAIALGLMSEDLRSSKRNRQVVYARQVAIYLCRELTALSLPAIAQQFGHKDHTTVLHAYRRIKAKLLSDPATRSLVTSLTDELGSTPR
jgi:chromosomal replication initiator protein